MSTGTDRSSTASSTGGAAQRQLAVPSQRAKPPAIDWARTNLAELCSHRHPNLAVTYGASELFGASVVVRELVPRGTLAEVLARTLAEGEAVPWEALQTLATGIAHGLAYLHESRPLVEALLGMLPTAFAGAAQRPPLQPLRRSTAQSGARSSAEALGRSR